MVMDCASAELSKYAANAMLATRISFMNEVANVCELVGADVDQVRKAIGADRRIGTSFLFPGCGYGGSCFPKDVQAMMRFAADRKYDFRILNAVERGQRGAEDAALREDEEALRLAQGQDRLACGAWRSSRRPTTCARRQSIPLIEALLSAGARVLAYDPGSDQGGARHLRRPDRVRGLQLRCPQGRRRPGDRHRVERVPAARFRPDEGADARPGRSSTAATSSRPNR